MSLNFRDIKIIDSINWTLEEFIDSNQPVSRILKQINLKRDLGEVKLTYPEVRKIMDGIRTALTSIGEPLKTPDKHPVTD